MIRPCLALLAMTAVAVADEPDPIGPQPPIGPEEKVVEVEPDDVPPPEEGVVVVAPRVYVPPPDYARYRAPASPHGNAGGEFAGGDNAISFVARFHGGVSYALGRGHLRPTIGVGGTLGIGTLGVNDLRALDGSVDLQYLDFGPEVQLGVRWITGGRVDTRLFASFAYLKTELDERLMIDSVEGVGGRRGMRAAVCLNWADALGRASSRNPANGAWVLFVLPQQIEVNWLDTGGSKRTGVTLSYGI